METKVPHYFQSYSDFYREYLHALDDYFANCYLLEHKFLENNIMGRKAWMKTLDGMVWSTTNISISNIEATVNLHNLFTQTQVSCIRILDTMLHLMTEYFNTAHPKPAIIRTSEKPKRMLHES